MGSNDPNQQEPNTEQDNSEGKKRLSDYKILSELGAGDFGTVYEVEDKNKKKFALKCIDLTTVSNPNQLRDRETKPIFLNHPNIVKCYDFWFEDNNLYVLLELCTRDTLDHWLINCTLYERKRRYQRIFIQMLEAVDYLHSHGLVHRDLKPSNIFFGYDGRVKIADFSTVLNLKAENLNGFVQHTTPQKHTTSVGTPGYIAPEVETGCYDHMVDVYSLGVILLEMITPLQTFEQRCALFDRLLRAEFPESCDKKFKNEFRLFKLMLSPDPKKRPKIAAIRQTQLIIAQSTELYDGLTAIITRISLLDIGKFFLVFQVVYLLERYFSNRWKK
ncbi:aurora kinase A-like [Bradysia coprophila]|uniref:aurora kinase A-like n=1 Tax=Bradysia coprophila TaxID=38358 RepID=UPI00187DC592|nr:aurora kinase A-like [Bradysia coprophila]